MKKFWTIYTVLCCIFCCEMASAQNLTKISGTVLDENNAPMAGVTISVNGKGATLSTSDGRFTLTNVPTGATISFSFIGYETEKVTVNSPKTVEAIRLVPAENSMREITVVGYGKQELGIIGQARRAEIVLVGRPTATRPCTRRIRK